MKVIDLTHTIKNGMPVFPGTKEPRLSVSNTYEIDGFKETLLEMSTHTGTHMDPPSHLYGHRTTLDKLPIDQFIGKALVIDCRDLKEGDSITMEQLVPYGDKIYGADFLLFNLGWDKRWGTEEYFADYPCVDDQVLKLIMSGGYKGIGFDVIGLDPIDDTALIRHKKLFKELDIVNIENLANLEQCGEELFWFSCFPLKIQEGDGSPIRAVGWFE